MFKRGVSEGDNEGGALVKKVRYEDDDSSSSSNALTTFTYSGGELASKKIDQVIVVSYSSSFSYFLSFLFVGVLFLCITIADFTRFASLPDQEDIFSRCTNNESIRSR